MSQSRAPSASNRGLGRVLLYYIAMGAVTALLIRFPDFRDAISGARLAELAAVDLFNPDVSVNPDVSAIGDPVATSTWARSIIAGISMLGALAIMIPVTWVYMVTRRQRGYHESVVHTLLILPRGRDRHCHDSSG